ncbi:hypothetical protein GF420_09690 [candidate division GN15 bacterium]|nr:hypothetical protein [candidate division GN15 bacterium]
MSGERQTVIFDLGDVLCHVDAIRSCHRLAGYSDLSADQIYSILYERPAIYEFSSGRLTPEQYYAFCRTEAHLDIDIETFHDIFCDIFTLNDSVVQLMSELRPVSQFLLLSNTNIWHFPYEDKLFDIAARFDHLILSYEVGAMKPEAAVYAATLPHIAHPDKAVFIDDIAGHVEAAEPFGITGVRFVDAGQLRTDLTTLGYL